MRLQTVRQTHTSSRATVAQLIPAALHAVRDVALVCTHPENLSDDDLDAIEAHALFNIGLEAPYYSGGESANSGLRAVLYVVSIVLADLRIGQLPDEAPVGRAVLLDPTWPVEYARTAVERLTPIELATLARWFAGHPPREFLKLAGSPEVELLNKVVLAHTIRKKKGRPNDST